MNGVAHTINDIQGLLAVCPCCGRMFRLVEGKFLFPQRPLKPCEYLELASLEQRLFDAGELVGAAEEQFEERLEAQRERLRKRGLRKAKRKLRKIDPTFSGSNINPQDVKVIFEPVEYVVFNGLNSERGVNLIEFVSRSPENRAEEVTVKSIDRSIRNGSISFETLHMRDDGSFEIRNTV